MEHSTYRRVIEGTMSQPEVDWEQYSEFLACWREHAVDVGTRVGSLYEDHRDIMLWLVTDLGNEMLGTSTDVHDGVARIVNQYRSPKYLSNRAAFAHLSRDSALMDGYHPTASCALAVWWFLLVEENEHSDKYGMVHGGRRYQLAHFITYGEMWVPADA